MNGFVDEAIIEVASGSGGPGAVHFRREKHVPRGGPDGGDGGRGGDVVFTVSPHLKTLSHLKMRRIFKAEDGRPGGGQRKHGRDGANAEVKVPPGTLVRDPDSGEVLRDFAEDPGEPWVFQPGGLGGKGNTHFKSSTRQTPRFAQPGIEGRSARLKVELAIIADIGLVGLPNSGKSTLLSVLTNARPKIGSYPFTTRVPNIGVLRREEVEVVLADIPGIIEGASEGAGLGLKFLKHISRTRVLLYCLDLGDESCLQTVEVLQAELAAYDAELARKPRLLLGTKLDLEGAADRLELLARRFPADTVLGVSALTHAGLQGLADRLLLEAHGKADRGEDDGARTPGGDDTPGARGYAERRGRRAMRIAIIGGTFNPLHLGHLFLAEEVRAALGYDRVLFIPTNRPVHKEVKEEIGPERRLEMVRLAVAPYPHLGVDDVELGRGGASYTIDTIDQLEARHRPDGRLGMVIGDDLARRFDTWKEPALLASRVDLIVAHRESAERLEIGYPCRYIDNVRLPISSSLIRRRVKEGRPVRFLVPDAVLSFIEDHGLYR